MQTSLRITFRHMAVSPALEARIREHVSHLARLHRHITGCEVVVGAPNGRHQNGSPFDVRVDLQLPDGHLHVHNDGRARAAHADVYLALHDAFDALARMLRRHKATQQRGRAHESIRKLRGTAREAGQSGIG